MERLCKVKDLWKFYPGIQESVKERLPDFYRDTLDVDVVAWDPALEEMDVETTTYKRSSSRWLNS